MTHFGILCPAAIGHLNPMCALGRELQRRNHYVTLFGVPDVAEKVAKSGLNFQSIGETEFPKGTLEKNYKQLGEMSGISGLKFTVKLLQKETSMLLDEGPEIIRKVGVEALLVDQLTRAGGTIADFVNLPFITVCNALLINQEPGVPPFFTHWSYRKTWWAYLRNQIGNSIINQLTKSIGSIVIKKRHQWQLSYSGIKDFYSSLAQICQLPAEFDFPRVNLPECFHFTGPLKDPSGVEPVSFDSISFPFEKLSPKPLIYASLGT